MEQVAFDFYSHIKNLKEIINKREFKSKEYKEAQRQYRELHGKFLNL